jgi:VanZ family protein
MSPNRRPAKRTRKAAAFYLLFVIYSSLLPLDFHPYPLASAWYQFAMIEYVPLRPEYRADWIANIALYIPFAYLTCLTFGRKRGASRLLTSVSAVLACGIVAVAIEFLQQFFPPRTVSQNDIVAELLGAALGSASWLVGQPKLQHVWTRVRGGGMPAIKAALVFYLVAYVTVSLFPYDLLLSSEEFASKLAADQGPTAHRCTESSICVASLLAELLAVIPIGVLFGMLQRRTAIRTYGSAFCLGAVLGIVIESSKLVMFSGIAEASSVLTRAFGIVGGVLGYRCRYWIAGTRRYPVLVLSTAMFCYIIVVVWANGLFTSLWLGTRRATAAFAAIHWLPFYYHYYTTESAALANILMVTAVYAPIGTAFWLVYGEEARAPRRVGLYAAGICAALMAALIETGKLFFAVDASDPTNVLIATAAAVACYLMCLQLQRWAAQESLSQSEP